MFEEGDIGVLPPLGVYDPLGLIEKRDMRRYEIMEIKHGRAAMLDLHDLVAAHVTRLDQAKRVVDTERREDAKVALGEHGRANSLGGRLHGRCLEGGGGLEERKSNDGGRLHDCL